jgi:chemotaxis protein CheX
VSSSTYPAVRPELGWKDLLESASNEVVELMAGARLEPWSGPYGEPKGDIVAIVGMAGALCGMTVVRCSTAAARSLGSRMLGEDGPVEDTTLCDALGEICNMIAGNFKSKIDALADGCQLSVPTVISGGDFNLRSAAADDAIRVALGLDGHPIQVTLLIRS